VNVLIINTGTELLLGDVLNTHLAFIAQQILPLGLRVQQQIAVPDGENIRGALRDAFQLAEIVFVTGGLGPTTDDITREITAELLGLTLRHDRDVMAAIEARAAARGFRLTDRIPRQAQVPDGATVLPNQFGTAPGLYLPPNVGSATKSPHLFLLPGPPRELRPMFRDHVLPILHPIAPAAANSAARHYHIAGVGESHVEEAIGDEILRIAGVELGYCAMLGEVVVRVIGDAAAVTAADAIIRQRFAHAIFATDETSLEETVVQMLAEQGSTIAVAESCTGGLLANRLTNVPGASAVFLAGYITYSDRAKSDLLQVEPASIAEHGAVSDVVARAMAEGARRRAGATHALAITGIAGPSGGTPEKPLGTVFIALGSADAPTEVVRDRFPSDRISFKQLATQSALEMLRQRLREHVGASS
jgi:nicotinamide-nucleotide amidase